MQFLGMYQKDTCTSVCIIAKTLKQPICPSANEWIKKMWCIPGSPTLQADSLPFEPQLKLIHTHTHKHTYNETVLVCMLLLHLCPTLLSLYGQQPTRLLSIGFSRQEYWSALPSLPTGDLPDPETKLVSPMSPALPHRFFTTSTTWEYSVIKRNKIMPFA